VFLGLVVQFQVATIDLAVTDANGNPWLSPLAFSLRKQSGAWYTPDPSQVTALGDGWYRITTVPTDTNTPGWLLATAQATGAVAAFAATWVGPDPGPQAGQTYYSIPFFLVTSAGQPILVASPSVLIDTPGGPGFTAPTGSVVEVGLGVYEVIPALADIATSGLMPIQATATGAQPFADEIQLLGPNTSFELRADPTRAVPVG
jgi:hypothetical protein